MKFFVFLSGKHIFFISN